MIAEHGSDAGLGDAVVSTDLLGGVAGFIAMGDVGDVVGGQEAL